MLRLSLIRFLVCTCSAFFLTGCPPEVMDERPAYTPIYQDLADRYNANLRGLDRIWASAVVEFKWREHRDEPFHNDQGEGHLIIMLPDRLALTVGKIGNTIIWAGCDPQRYWMLDLRDERVAFVGRHEQFDSKKMPLPIRPIDLPRLLGIVRVPTDTTAAVTWRDGCWVIEPPGTHDRVFLHPQSALPIRIEWLDEVGQRKIVSRLSRHKPVLVTGVAPGERPRIASRIELSVAGEEGEEGGLTLFLSDATNDKDKFNAKAFQFEHLVEKAFKIEQVVDLDLQTAEEHVPN